MFFRAGWKLKKPPVFSPPQRCRRSPLNSKRPPASASSPRTTPSLSPQLQLKMNDLQRRQVEETQYREDRSKASWAMMHAEAEAGRVTAFHIDDMKHQRLHSLKEQVADWAIG